MTDKILDEHRFSWSYLEKVGKFCVKLLQKTLWCINIVIQNIIFAFTNATFTFKMSNATFSVSVFLRQLFFQTFNGSRSS